MCIYTQMMNNALNKQLPEYYETKDCYCLEARRQARTITRLYEEKLRPHGLRATQFSVLATLKLKGPTPVTELADFLVLERTTMTRSAAVMAKKGWIEPATTDDARVRAWQLTSQGHQKLAEAFPAWKSVQDVLSSAGPTEDSV